MEQYISKDALLAEIERRIKINKECMLGLRNLDYYQGKVDALNDTLSSLDTLEVKEVQKEPVSEDLEEAAIEYCGGNKGSDARVRAGFIMGAKWQKEQMMAKAIDGEVGYWNQRGLSVLMELPRELEKDDKCKVIIIKED